MKQLPKNIRPYAKTLEFTEVTVSAGLLKDHQTKKGVWGKIVILAGQLEYTILEPAEKVIQLTEDRYGVVEPTVLHHIKPLGPIRFYVEFHRG